MFTNKIILVTGGTGTIGSFLVRKLIETKCKKIIVFSRDENKQFELKNIYSDLRIEYIIGDVRNYQSVESAARNIDYIIHTAAMKHVPIAEENPLETSLTNIIGTNNSSIIKDVDDLVTDLDSIYMYNVENLDIDNLYEIEGLSVSNLNKKDFYIDDDRLFFRNQGLHTEIFLADDNKFYSEAKLTLDNINTDVNINIGKNAIVGEPESSGKGIAVLGSDIKVEEGAFIEGGKIIDKDFNKGDK